MIYKIVFDKNIYIYDKLNYHLRDIFSKCPLAWHFFELVRIAAKGNSEIQKQIAKLLDSRLIKHSYNP